MIYEYDSETSPDLDNLEVSISNSDLVSKYDFLRWDLEDKKLKVYFTEELIEEEINILNNLIDNI